MLRFVLTTKTYPIMMLCAMLTACSFVQATLCAVNLLRRYMMSTCQCLCVCARVCFTSNKRNLLYQNTIKSAMWIDCILHFIHLDFTSYSFEISLSWCGFLFSLIQEHSNIEWYGEIACYSGLLWCSCTINVASDRCEWIARTHTHHMHGKVTIRPMQTSHAV